MDHRSDVAPGSASDRARPVETSTVRCEQAVFTSIATPTGSGYRLVGASPGIKPTEKQQITTRSPSHQALCATGPEASGVSFYRLDTERSCLAYTCCAGLEGTARGGQRIYTRVLVFDDETLRRAGYNPFDLLRAWLASGHAEPNLKPPPQLPAIELPIARRSPFEALAQAAAAVGPDRLLRAVEDVLEHRPLVMVGDFSWPDLVEAVLLSVPGPLRQQVSFGAGLCFSLNRRFDVNALSGDERRLQQVIQGHGHELLSCANGPPASKTGDRPWLQMVTRRWSERQGAALARLTSRSYEDCSAQTLDHYAELCNQRDGLAECGVPAMICLLDQHLLAEPGNEIEAELTIELVRDTLRGLADRFSTAVLDELRPYWSRIVVLWNRTPRTVTLLSGLVGAMLKRLTRLSALTAAEAAAEIVAPSARLDADVAPVRQALTDLLGHLIEWCHDAEPTEVEQLPRLLGRWPADPGLASRLVTLQSMIEERLAEEAAESGATK